MLGIYHELVYLFFEKISKLLAKRSKQILYLRYYSPMKTFFGSQIPSEVMNHQKKLAISYCGRVVAVPNMDNVDLLATSPDINDPFDDDTNTPGTVL